MLPHVHLLILDDECASSRDMGMCRKMAAINDHFQTLEDELEIRDRKYEQIAHDMNIVLTLFSKFEKRVARTEHRTQHQAKSLKHLTNATTRKQDELASRLQNLTNTTTTKQDELASRLQNLSNATTTKQDELASRLQNLSNATTTKQDELASMLQNLSNSTKQEMSATSSKQEELARMLQNLSNATTTKQDELASRLQNLSNATTTKQDELASTLQNLSNATATKQDELASSLQNLDNKVSIPIFIICSIRNRVVRGTSQFTQMHSGVTARIFRPQKFSRRKTSASRSFPGKSFTSASFH